MEEPEAREALMAAQDACGASYKVVAAAEADYKRSPSTVRRKAMEAARSECGGFILALADAYKAYDEATAGERKAARAARRAARPKQMGLFA
jgi:hypothetical protein